MRIAFRLLLFGLVSTTLVRSVVALPPDDPKPPVGAEVKPAESPNPIFLFLNTPADREAFWKMLAHPDQVVLDGELYRKLRLAADALTPPARTSTSVVEAISVTGSIESEWAHLRVEYRVALEADGPTWVPIHLDSLTLSDAREGSRPLPTRMTEARDWQVEIRGKGAHLVRVELLAPVRSTAEGRRLDLPILPVASTQFELAVANAVIDATTGINEQVGIVAVDGTGGSKLTARLSPRTRIELAWREHADPASRLAALLAAKGDISVEVERGSLRTRSSWGVTAIRGTVNQVTLRLDPAEEVLEVEVDNRPVQVETLRQGGRSVLTIPLTEPLKPNTTRGLTLSTRRPIASTGAVRVSIQGYSFDQAKVQSGMLAIARTGPLFLNPTPGRGLRRIDPKTELSDNLRSKAETVLAFEFNDQPFELGLSIDPAPPRLRVESRTTVSIDPQSARIQTRLECSSSQGRVFEVQVTLPKGLELEATGPADVVESAQVVPLDPRSAVAVGSEIPRLLSITLTPQAREADSFTIVLKGWSALDSSRPVELPLFQPALDASTGTRFAILSDRNVSVEPSTEGGETSGVRLDWGLPPSDWAWPALKPAPDQGLLWLRSDANPAILPLRVTVHARSIRFDSTMNAVIDRRGAEVVDEIAGEVAFGSLSRLDLALPREIPALWEIEGVELLSREPLEIQADGYRRYRLRFSREYTDLFRLRIRYRLPFVEPPSPEHEGKLRLASIRVPEGTSGGRRVLISADPSIEVRANGAGWTATAPVEPSPSSDTDPPVRLALSRTNERAEPLEVVVRPGPQMSVPTTVVSRLWIKTVQRPENDLATTAYFWVETRESSMAIGLSPGSIWVGARVGSTEAGESGVEPAGADVYRLRFPPSTPSGPILVVVQFVVPAPSASESWPTLRLLGGGVVQQTVWEAEVLGARAGVGTPSGWLDENDWYWNGLLWQRRPWKSPLELANWLSGGSIRYRLADSLEMSGRTGRHSYLFSRVGPPIALRFPVFSRFTLLLLCSGPVLFVGLLVLLRRPPPRTIAAALVMLTFTFALFVEMNVLILILQSSILGIVLCISALVMHWAIERRGPTRPKVDPVLVAGSAAVTSSPSRVESVGSDDSTAIRVRPISPSAISTADHIVLSRIPTLPLDEPSPSDLDLR